MATILNKNKAKEGSRAQSGWTEQLLEVSVFLFLIVPSMVLSFFAIRQGNVSFMLAAISAILRDLALVSLVLFFIWRNGEPLRSLGWSLKHSWQDMALGLGLFIPLFFGAGILENLLQAAGLSVPSMPLPSFLAPRRPVEFLVAFVLVVVVALAEETIFRGYLILRFRAITASRTAAVVLSAVIFSLGHGYEGSAGVVTVGVMGAVFALIYLWRRSLVAPVVMHFLQDFLSIILVPLLVGVR
jgi:membrane protease YdiL (CAAX protease family)